MMIIIHREGGDLRWTTPRRRLWLNAPHDPRTGEPRRILWLWLVPFIILYLVSVMLLKSPLDDVWGTIFPIFAEPPLGFDPGDALGLPEVQAQLVGAWWFLGLFLALAVFNTFLGEEFLFGHIETRRKENEQHNCNTPNDKEYHRLLCVGLCHLFAGLCCCHPRPARDGDAHRFDYRPRANNSGADSDL
jgi:hypothetical protein